MANIVNQYGQVKVGVRVQSSPLMSTLMNSLYSVYNADSVGLTSLKTSLYSAYNGESNANDSFGSNNGTAQGGLTYGTGKIGNAFQFNGTNAYVSLSNDILNFTGDFSYSFWVYPNNTTNQQMLICNWKPGSTYGYGYYAYMINNNLYFEIAQGNDISIYYVPLSGGSTWYNISITRKSSNNTKIYINGTLINGTYVRGNSTQNPVYQTGQINNIGTYNNGAGVFFNGKIDAINIWNKELTASEITELYNSGNGAQYIGDSFYKPSTNDALNTYNGTAQGGLTYGVGKVGTAFQFNGTNAYVQLPNNSLNFTTFSISAWVNPSNTVGSRTILNSANYVSGLDYGWKFRIIDGQLSLQIYSTGGLINEYKGGSIPTNTWTHVSATRINGSTKLYINGSLVGSQTSGNINNIPNFTTTTYCSIGSLTSAVAPISFFIGSIDALNTWTKELSASEITELYNSGNGKQYPN